jgi:hypothetical protein
MKCYDQEKIDKLFRVNGQSLPSIKQCVSYNAELMFGCKLVKNEQGCWILDNPLDPTHELNLDLKEPHPRYNFAEQIKQRNYYVVKPGRLWQLRNQEDEQFLETGEQLIWGYNTHHLLLLNCDKFLVRYTEKIQHQILHWQKVEEYSVEIPAWNRHTRRIDDYRIEKHMFVHVGPRPHIFAVSFIIS